MKFMMASVAALFVAGAAFANTAAPAGNCEITKEGKATHTTEKTEADCAAKGGKWMGQAQHGKTETKK